MAPEDKLLYNILSNWGDPNVTHSDIKGWINDFSLKKTETIRGQLIADDIISKIPTTDKS